MKTLVDAVLRFFDWASYELGFTTRRDHLPTAYVECLECEWHRVVKPGQKVVCDCGRYTFTNGSERALNVVADKGRYITVQQERLWPS